MMRVLMGYFFGLTSGIILFVAFICYSELIPFSVAYTIGSLTIALLVSHQRHIKKRKEYYDRFIKKEGA